MFFDGNTLYLNLDSGYFAIQSPLSPSLPHFLPLLFEIMTKKYVMIIFECMWLFMSITVEKY